MRNSSKILFYLLFAITISLNLPKQIYAVELMTNGGFETGTFAPWVSAYSGCTDNASSYSPASVATSKTPGFGTTNIAAFAGTVSAFNGWACGPNLATGTYYSPTGAGNYTIYQDVTVPAGNSITLKFSEMLSKNLAFFTAPDWRSARSEQYKVEIRNTSNVVLATPFQVTAPANTVTNTPWTSHTFNLGATYAGQTIRIAFVWVISTGYAGPGNAAIDAVSVNAFVPTAAESSVTGRIATVEGRGISRARLTITDSQSGVVRYASTNQLGYYNFSGLESGHFYILNASSKSYVFNPDTQSFQLNENLEGVNFIGTIPDSR